MSALCRNLSDILEQAVRMALEDEDLLDAYQFPAVFQEILRIDPGYRRLAPVLRLDGHFVRGVFRIVETNADGSAGMNDSNAIERALLATPLYSYFADRGPIESLEMVDSLARMLARYSRVSGDRGATCVGILDRRGISTASEFVAVQQALRRLGQNAVLVTPEDLAVRDGLRARGTRITLVYRRLVTADAFQMWSSLGPLLEAYRAGAIRMVGSFRSELLHSKAVLAIMRDSHVRARIGPAGRRLIDRHVPPAFLLTPASAERTVSARRRWILKPLDSYGSRGVFVGNTLTRKSWKKALAHALAAGRYLLQEYVPAPREPVLRIVDNRPKISMEMTSVGFFIYDGVMAGPYVRSGPAHPLSISYGAVTRPGFRFRAWKRA